MINFRTTDNASPQSGDLGLREKVVLITGAGQGIGQAAAQAFASYGSYVVVSGRTRASCEATLSELPPDRTLFCAADVSQEPDVARLVRAAVDRFGRLDIAFNNAGTFGAFAPLHDDKFENFEHVVATNLRGTWLCMKHEIGAMLSFGGGAIVNCASVAAHIGHAQSAVYSATKHAVLGLTKSAALQYGRCGVRINAVSPGSTDTPMLRTIYPSESQLQARATRAPLGRIGLPREIAQAVLWLSSPLSSYTTGQAIAVDGGVTAGTAANNKPT